MTEEITTFEVGKWYGYKYRYNTSNYYNKAIQITRRTDKTVWFKVLGDDKEYRRKIRMNVFLEELIFFDDYSFVATNEAVLI